MLLSSAGGQAAADPAVCSSVGWHVNCLARQPCLQDVVAQFLGLAPTEEGRQMLHYVVPHELAPQLQQLLDMLDMSEGELGLAEVHVSLATLEEVFLAVVKQVCVSSRDAGLGMLRLPWLATVCSAVQLSNTHVQ
jgi:hypothetical protein